MYTVTGILTAATVLTEPFTKQGVTVRISDANQLIGTYSDLLRFVSSNIEYKGWEVHHIFEALDVERLKLGAFAPAYAQQICVLLPAAAHHRINSILRRANPTSLSATSPELESAYKEAYLLVGNYCGSTETAVSRELFGIFKSVLKNMVDAAAAAMNEELKRKSGDLQRLQNKISRQKGLHDTLIRGSSLTLAQQAELLPSLINPAGVVGVLAGAVAGNKSSLATVGAAVNLFNPQNRPALDIWAKAEADVRSASQALARGDVAGAVVAIAKGEVHFTQADTQFTAWRDGIELAARRAQLAVGVAAVVATAVAVTIYAYPVVAGASAVTGTAVSQTATGPRIAADVVEAAEAIFRAQTVAQEQAAERTFVRVAEQLGDELVEELPKIVRRQQLPKP